MVAKSWREDQLRASLVGLMDDLFDSLISDLMDHATSPVASVADAGPMLQTSRVKLRLLVAADAPAFHR